MLVPSGYRPGSALGVFGGIVVVSCDGDGVSAAHMGVKGVQGGSVEPSSVLQSGGRDASRLRQLLVARYGWELGVEAWQEAMAYAWEHREAIASMDNPFGYLYRVAQSSVRRGRRWRRRVTLPAAAPSRLPDVEPGLPAALALLSSKQRVAVLLVHAHGWTQLEAARALEIDVSTLRNHLRRGMARLRIELGVHDGEPG